MYLRVRAALGGLAMLCAAHTVAQSANVAAIQASEVRKADVRTLAALEAFRTALIARFGADPTLTMLRWSESEGSALVQTSGGATEYVIRQGDAWVSTANRKLVPWAPPAVATANAFRLSSVKSAPIRAWLDAWRKAPGQATDFITDYEAGYEPSAARLVVRARVGSMTTFGLAQHAFDPSTGGAVTIAAAPRPVPKAIATAQKRTDDLRRDASAALAALRKVEPSARDVWYRHWVELGFRSLEAQLQSPATGRCCHGDAPGLADCCLVPQVYNARRYDVDLSAFPTIERIAAHCESLPAFQAARPDAQPDAE